MPVQIRVDDYPTAKPQEMDRHNSRTFGEFNRVIRETTGKKYLLGVIPNRCNDEELWRLGEDPNIVVGMHGIDHDERFQNEFRDHHTQKDVETLLAGAKNDLEELVKRSVDVYMPPHNVIDGRTIRALKTVGFKAFTGGPENRIYRKKIVSQAEEEGIRYLHSEPPLEYGRSDELLQRGSVEHLLKIPSDRTVYLTLHWTWENNIGLGHLEQYLSLIKDVVEDFSL